MTRAALRSRASRALVKATDVRHATPKVDDAGVITLVAGVDAVAVALKNSSPVFWVFAEGLFEVFATPPLLPTVADVAMRARVIEDPGIPGAGFPGAGGEFFDGRFVNLEVALGEAFLMDRFGDGPQKFEAAQGPVIEGVARGVEAEALKDVLLPVKRKVVAVF